MIKAVIFDLDGVLIDSERQSLLTNRDFLLGQGVEPRMEELAALVGTTDLENCRYMARVLGVGLDEARGMLEACWAAHPMDCKKLLRREAADFLEYLKGRGIPMALATNSPMDFVHRVLAECGLGGCFDPVVSGRSLGTHKPDPGIYLHTTRMLGLPPEELLVVEDSPAGVEAARRAGIPVAGLRDPFFAFDLSRADFQVDSFAELRTILERGMV